MASGAVATVMAWFVRAWRSRWLPSAGLILTIALVAGVARWLAAGRNDPWETVRVSREGQSELYDYRNGLWNDSQRSIP